MNEDNLNSEDMLIGARLLNYRQTEAITNVFS